MVALTPQSDFGQAPPPQTPYSIVTNLPTWKSGQRIRDGDFSIVSKLTHLYPRFGPRQYVAQLGLEISKKCGQEGKGCFAYLNPEMVPYTIRHATNSHREEHVLKEEDITIKVVDVAGHRVYALFFKPQHAFGVMLSWGNPGVGISIRGAEQLLKGVQDLKEVPFGSADELPEPTWTPESEAHDGLRKRITELCNRARVQKDAVPAKAEDVFLYPTGMAAIYHSANRVLEYKPGTIVIIGVVFHNTHHHFVEESPYGFKHVGKVDEAAMNEFEDWLQSEKEAGKPVSYVIVEFPGNPTLDTPDLARIKRLSEKYGFVLVADDTVASFASVDLLPDCDILLTSLTKSFSGLSDVLGGSVVLSPTSPHYSALKSTFNSKHHNELFAADAEVLLSNSQGYLNRTTTINRNATALSKYVTDRMANDPDCPVVKVRHPSVLPSKALYDPYLRPSTPDLPEPGYGCLLTLDFEDLDAAVAFYDNCGLYSSPHLGAHVTIMLAYSMVVFGRAKEEMAAMAELGAKEEAVRISVGLEKEEDIIDTVRVALDKAIELKKKGYKTEE